MKKKGNYKSNPKNKIFIRYGKLALVKQKGYGSGTFHSPPTQRGCYAMPYLFQELFLISSIEKFQPQLPFPKNNIQYDSNTPMSEIKIMEDEYFKNRKKFLKKIKKTIILKGHEYFWHHLENNVKPHQVINRHGSWIKTSFKTWEKLLAKESLKLRVDSSKSNGINSINKTTGYYGKDHFEVFFDKKYF